MGLCDLFGRHAGHVVAIHEQRHPCPREAVDRIDQAPRPPAEAICHDGCMEASSDSTYPLPVAMTGRASPAKAALGDKPVFDYISRLPQPQREIAERVDALAARRCRTCSAA